MMTFEERIKEVNFPEKLTIRNIAKEAWNAALDEAMKVVKGNPMYEYEPTYRGIVSGIKELKE